MKRILLFSLICLLMGGLAAAQDNTFVYESTHYRVRSNVSADHAQSTADQLEALAVLFNDFFHFDLDELDNPLRVQVFREQPQFDRYLERLIGETRDEFVYLHYSDPSRSELVGFLGTNQELGKSMTHQAFIQFIRAFVPNPPLWLREGFAVYFEEAQYEPGFGAAVAKENLSWLETLKTILFGERIGEALTPEQILAIDTEAAREQIQVFYPEAWGVVNYLVNTDIKAHNRILWDSIAALSPEASLAENSARVLQAAFRWVPEEDLLESFLSYFDGKKTYRELIEGGVAAYEGKALDDAEYYFQQAINRRDTSYIPYYYLGLINYDRGNHSLAGLNYQQALEKGATPALTYYALGVNAFAATEYEEAREYLETTVRLDPDSFTDKAGEILARIEG
ncbi:tetratricopeptide repeat protein [Spirochaeta lutea]|uniref:DUF1570 domain-containing protein n=1 Tax=Spirochaeta lutea TaxID=1480694 RepID=A0A098QSN3_9SPIO|nr:tetratricopeptide repeat protein [Spirochaeta lutea]KGE70754.1 hypothetical protein DC28_14745 [Spirochaeta lutea]